MHEYFEKSISRSSVDQNVCYKDADEAVRYKILEEYERQAFHFSNICPVNNHPIEKIVHYIWISKHKNDDGRNKEISERNLKLIEDKNNKILQSGANIKCICWVNDEKLIPKTINRLEGLGIEVRNIHSVQNNIPGFNIAVELFENGCKGFTIDYFKYEILRIFGGIVLDINYILKVDNLADYLNAYSFFIGAAPIGRKVGFENSMIAAYKGHHIMEKVCDKIFNMLQMLEFNKINNVGTTDNFFIEFSNVVLNNLNPYADNAPEEVCYKSASNSFIGWDMHENSWISIGELGYRELT